VPTTGIPAPPMGVELATTAPLPASGATVTFSPPGLTASNLQNDAAEVAENLALADNVLKGWNGVLFAIAGVTMIDHFKDFEQFETVGATFFTAVPAFMTGHQRYFTWAVVVGGTLFLAYYVCSYAKLSRQGYSVSPLKTYLLASTGLRSIYTWGFNTWGEAFFIMNFFHAFQYFGVVWAFENKRMIRFFRVERLRFGKPLTVCLFVALAFGYGLWVQSLDSGIQWLWAITLVVSILHFWYDGFIWSVRKRQV
jgi:hypothetical protein